MTQQEISRAYNRAIGSLDNKEIKNAFDTLQGLLSGTGEFCFQDKLDTIQDTYKNMLRYRVEGAQDPMQEHIYNTLQVQAYELADSLRRQSARKESSLTYYSHLRNLSISAPVSFAELHRSLASKADLGDQAGLEKDLANLFAGIWLSDTLSLNETEEIREVLRNHELPYPIGSQIVSALTLGMQSLFDANKVMLLFDAAVHPDNQIRIRAYVGLLLTFYLYQKRIRLYPSIYNRLELLSENERFVKTLRDITLRFISARETEKITRRLHDEILPEMLKMNARIKKKTDLTDISPDLLQGEMNPEWMELMEESGISKKLEEFSELQQEGADVMHSTFFHMKSFPFFSSLSNWFLPFMTNFSSFKVDADGMKQTNQLFEMIEESSFLCNSDKYSLHFSIMRLVDKHRGLMMRQFGSEVEEFVKQTKSNLPGNSDTIIANQYIQDLYRFFKLYPARLDFEDIFALPLDFHHLDILKPYLSDEESLLIIAEFYLRKNYFNDALTIYSSLAEKQKDNAILFQKTGYCHQMNGDFEKALEDYLHADIIAPDKWLTRKIAFCYKAMKLPREALTFYLKYDKAQPDNMSTLNSIGHCYLELKEYNEALKYFHKVDYLDNKSNKTWRPIAWCSFLMGKYDQARNYYRKILDDNPGSQDYLNAGHTEWAMQNLKTALEFYRQAVQSESGDINRIKELFFEDKEDLLVAGIEENEFPLMLDQLMYSL